jgi:hypothetical protein
MMLVASETNGSSHSAAIGTSATAIIEAKGK